jgi:flap endonuclease-1
MGVKNLNTLIEKFSPNGKIRKHLSEFSGLTLAIDTNVYLYKYLYGKSNHIDGMFFMVNKFKKFGINPIFIFDGKPPEEKINTITNRRENKLKLHERIMDLKAQINLEGEEKITDEITTIEKRIVFVNYDIIQSTKDLLKYMGIPYIDSNTEAEHYCSKLNKVGLVYGVVSEDMDTLACGSNIVFRNFSNRDDMIDVYNLNSILLDTNLTYDSFIDMCILLGNDYNPRIRGYTPDEIYNDIVKYRNIENIIENKDIKLICDVKRMRDIYKTLDIEIDEIKFNYGCRTTRNLFELMRFLRDNSNIDEATIKHRVDKMYHYSPLSSPHSNSVGYWR